MFKGKASFTILDRCQIAFGVRLIENNLSLNSSRKLFPQLLNAQGNARLNIVNQYIQSVIAFVLLHADETIKL